MTQKKYEFGKIDADRRFEPLDLQPLQVVVSDFSSFEEAVRMFRTKVNKEKIMSLYKEHSAYEKPSDKKRRKKREAIHRKFLESLPSKKNDKDMPEVE